MRRPAWPAGSVAHPRSWVLVNQSYPSPQPLICCAFVLACAWPMRGGADDTALSGPDFQAQRADIEQRLATAITEMEAARARLDASSEQTKSRIDELTTELRARQAFIDIYEMQSDALSRLQDLSSRTKAAARALEDWQPPAGDPPWSLAMGDTTLLALFQAEATASRLTAAIDRSQLRLAEIHQERDKAESRSRTAEEKALEQREANATASDDKDHRLARLELAYYNEVVYEMDLEYQSRVQEVRLNEIEIERLRKTLRHFDGRFYLSPAALADKTRAIETKLEQLRTLMA